MLVVALAAAVWLVLRHWGEAEAVQNIGITIDVPATEPAPTESPADNEEQPENPGGGQ